jgi:hypothetical protein
MARWLVPGRRIRGGFRSGKKARANGARDRATAGVCHDRVGICLARENCMENDGRAPESKSGANVMGLTAREREG